MTEDNIGDSAVRRRQFLSIVGAGTMVGLSGCGGSPEVTTISSDNTVLEEKYTEQGPNSANSTTIKDQNGENLYKIFYPESLSEDTPVISWGNGTGQNPDVYTVILSHLASWGFIVIDNYDGDTAPGRSILDSCKYMIQQNENSSSIFYQKVDTDNIGVSGHSQGGGGIVNAHTEHQDGDIIKTIVPVAFPSLIDSNPEQVTVPMFFISGSDDGFLSSTSTNRDAYDDLPEGVPAALGIRKTVGHNAIVDTTTERGYLTAWMRFQLAGDMEAREVFAGSAPELLANPNWDPTLTKNMS